MIIAKYKILLITVFSVLVAIVSATGQKVLVADYSHGVNEFDIQSCEEKPKYLRHQIPPIFRANDITLTPDGTIYANCNNYRTYFLQKVLPYSTDSNPVDSCYFMNESSISTLAGVGGMFITSNERGEILGVNNNFVKYNPKTKSWKNFGAFPDYSDGIDPAFGNIVGSLTHRGDDFYFIGGAHWYDAGPGNNIRGPKKLIKLDTLHPENSIVLYQFADNMQVWNLFTIRNSCDEYTTYAVYIVYKEPELKIPVKKALAILDFDTYQLTDVCIDDPNTSQDNFLDGGVADPWTILSKDCIVTVDLDFDNSSGAQGRYDYTDTVGCRYDSIYLSDIDPEVFAKTYIDSLQVFFDGVAPDGADEYLEVSNSGGLGINWRNPKFVTFINNTNDDFLPLEVALRSIKYRNLSSTPTYGERKIAFVAYSGKRQSDTAYAFINLIDDKPYAGRDTMLNLCVNDAPVYLDSLLSDNADMQGLWTGTTMQSGVFDPITDDTGIYQYIVEKDGCTTDT
ncbi:MAG TPA: hypothetical protein ENK91_02640, partial [Bacteroidetes bacterium]|nr:hypothetical protein [Bacteroidota bacterium]